MTVRYGLLALYAPAGLAALMLHPSRRPVLRVIAVAGVLIFALCSVVDHGEGARGRIDVPTGRAFAANSHAARTARRSDRLRRLLARLQHYVPEWREHQGRLAEFRPHHRYNALAGRTRRNLSSAPWSFSPTRVPLAASVWLDGICATSSALLGSARTWPLVALACVLLIGLRSWFFLAWEESYFDSDQAIVGLMAKHLIEGRAFPLFFYGQEYMLAVEAWLVAPFVAVMGPSVLAVRTALVALNLGAALLLVRLLMTEAQLGGVAALLAASPFVMAPVIAAAHLEEAQGGNIEPFLWVLCLWLLRRRPMLCGICLGVAFLNREFSLYAAPALLMVQIVEQKGITRALAQQWAVTAFAFLVTFNAIGLLKPFADLWGPGTAGIPADTADTISALSQQLRLPIAEGPGRILAFVRDDVPLLLGIQSFLPSLVSINTDVRVGWQCSPRVPVSIIAMVVGLVLVHDHARRKGSGRHGWTFPLYLILVGAIAAIAYPLAAPPSFHTLRYGLLVLMLPIGAAALAPQPWRPRLAQIPAAACLVALSLAAAVDHVRVVAHAYQVAPAHPLRDLTAALEAQGSRRIYFFRLLARCTASRFSAVERAQVATSHRTRILEYERLAAHAAAASAPGRSSRAVSRAQASRLRAGICAPRPRDTITTPRPPQLDRIQGRAAATARPRRRSRLFVRRSSRLDPVQSAESRSSATADARSIGRSPRPAASSRTTRSDPCRCVWRRATRRDDAFRCDPDRRDNRTPAECPDIFLQPDHSADNCSAAPKPQSCRARAWRYSANASASRSASALADDGGVIVVLALEATHEIVDAEPGGHGKCADVIGDAALCRRNEIGQ